LTGRARPLFASLTGHPVLSISEGGDNAPWAVCSACGSVMSRCPSRSTSTPWRAAAYAFTQRAATVPTQAGGAMKPIQTGQSPDPALRHRPWPSDCGAGGVTMASVP
jgi:hypothetical protein